MTDYSAMSPNDLIGNMFLYALTDMSTDEIIGVMLHWHGIGAFYRVDRKWDMYTENLEELEEANQTLIEPEKAVDFIAKWDTQDSELDDELDYYEASDQTRKTYFPWIYGEESITAAAGPFTCPPATQDIMLNLENRKKAINSVGYGPMNPDRPNVDFWEEKAKTWGTTAEEAKTSRCANCAMFIRTSSMLQCIEEGLAAGDQSDESAWGAIDAGDLGYCEAFDFKCAAARTCDAWVAGGPVTEED